MDWRRLGESQIIAYFLSYANLKKKYYKNLSNYFKTTLKKFISQTKR
jgi:hypothetical protein